jgi:hypothetical protein
MPYEIRKIPNSKLYRVVNTENGAIKANHTTRGNAQRQVRLLMSLEKDEIRWRK